MYYYHLNALGSSIALSDAAGNVQERYSYEPFGKPTIYNAANVVVASSSFNNPYLFTGREYDPESGLYYYRARHYSPNLGRFIQQDPIGQYGDINNHGNAYTYVGNNVVNVSDPLGLVFYGNWCGFGGGGKTKNRIDICCMKHDRCWDRYGQEGFSGWFDNTGGCNSTFGKCVFGATSTNIPFVPYNSTDISIAPPNDNYRVSKLMAMQENKRYNFFGEIESTTIKRSFQKDTSCQRNY